MTCSGLASLSAFCFAFFSSRLLAPRVGVQLVPSVYLYKVQYVLHNLVNIHHCETDSCYNHYTHTLCVLLHSALLELLSLREAKCSDKVTQLWGLSAPSLLQSSWWSESVSQSSRSFPSAWSCPNVYCNYIRDIMPMKIIITKVTVWRWDATRWWHKCKLKKSNWRVSWIFPIGLAVTDSIIVTNDV